MKRFFHHLCLSALTVSAVSSALSTAAQEKKVLGLEELIPGGSGRTAYYAQDLGTTRWWGDKVILWKDAAEMPTSSADFSENLKASSEEHGVVVSLDAATGKEAALFPMSRLHALLEKEGLGKVYDLAPIRFPYPDKKQMQVRISGKGYAWIDFERWTMDRFIPVPAEAAHADVSPSRLMVAYTKGNNLFVGTGSGEQTVTSEPEGIVCGQSVHRDEFGISKGTFWNPQGNLLAFYRMDESMVTPYPLVNTAARVAEVSLPRYPMAGMTSHKVQVGIYDPSTQKTVYLQTGDPTDRYFTNISWSPDGRKLYMIELNRDQNHARLLRYDAASGQMEACLLEEKNEKYVQPLHPIAFLPWEKDAFLYRSQRDGYDHFYLYRTDGTLLGQLTRGEWIVHDLLGFDEKTHEVIFTSSQSSPLSTHAWRMKVEVKGTSMAQETPRLFSLYRDGWQTPSLSPSGRFLLSWHESHELYNEVDLLDGYGKLAPRHLLSAPNPYKDCVMPSIEVGTLQAADGHTPLYYRLLKPADFDPAKKYPVVIYVYGGPGVRLIADRPHYDARGWDLYMANRGYLVFSLDGRGSSGRGFDFESCTFRHLGIEECKDQMCGVDFLKSLPFVDSTRIGVHGWSFGGHMTTALMLRYPDTFRAGVAGGAVIDWKYYEVMYGERYMDTPQQNPEGYEACDLKKLAGQLKGRLLMIHDDQDPVVVPQHVVSFLQACVEARTYPDFFLYPGHEHNVLGRDRVHLHEKITRYFDEYLK